MFDVEKGRERMDKVAIAGVVPGALGRVTELHAVYYGRAWGFGLVFEAQVASGLAEFLPRIDPERDGFWTVSQAGSVQGAVAIDAEKAVTQGAHLRWFILADDLRGLGLGDRLLGEAVGFCRRRQHPAIYLWTFQGLAAARHLYEKHGFRLAEERLGSQWGTQVMEQRFVLSLA